jgi:hypothetical protein
MHRTPGSKSAYEFSNLRLSLDRVRVFELATLGRRALRRVRGDASRHHLESSLDAQEGDVA